MSYEPLEIKAALQIGRPPHEVFETIVDPAKMSHYFISESSGRIEAGKSLTWRFPELDMDVPVRIEAVEQDKFVSYIWDGEDGRDHLVEISLAPYGDKATVVTVVEKGGFNDEDGIKWLKGNTEGWANFLACMKAYIEYGINLRRGAFDFRFDGSAT
jgi:uncharacterized protein YndB with AHSA1/START domain